MARFPCQLHILVYNRERGKATFRGSDYSSSPFTGAVPYVSLLSFLPSSPLLPVTPRLIIQSFPPLLPIHTRHPSLPFPAHPNSNLPPPLRFTYLPSTPPLHPSNQTPKTQTFQPSLSLYLLTHLLTNLIYPILYLIAETDHKNPITQ